MAYSDLQDYLRRLETAGKLHWVDKPVDPSWEVSAVTRHLFDRYGWNERPALGFRHVGDSPLPLVIGVAVRASASSSRLNKSRSLRKSGSEVVRRKNTLA